MSLVADKVEHGEAIAVAGNQPHPGLVPAGQNAEAIMLDFVQPARAGRRRLGRRGQAGVDDPQPAGTLTQHATVNRSYHPKSRIGGQSLHNSSGSLAMLAAIRHASSRATICGDWRLLSPTRKTRT